MDLEYKTVFKSEGFGAIGGIGLEIKLATTEPMPDLNEPKIWHAIRDAAENISNEISAGIKMNQTGFMVEIMENASLIKMFDQPIYVEEIQNGYCDKWCCRHLPWFIITTKIGRLKIGWRKRVIHIEWTETINKFSAEDLFPNENVTKYEKIIHAWSEEKAKEYIDKIING